MEHHNVDTPLLWPSILTMSPPNDTAHSSWHHPRHVSSCALQARPVAALHTQLPPDGAPCPQALVPMSTPLHMTQQHTHRSPPPCIPSSHCSACPAGALLGGEEGAHVPVTPGPPLPSRPPVE